MTQKEQIRVAKKFADDWNDRGDEKQETQRFWIQLLQNVLGVADGASYIEFEKRVKLSHTSFIDAYIATTKVLIEQKGVKIDLHKAYEQSDGAVLTPFEQAKRYVGEMKASEKPRWIVVCNFAEFLIYDLENPQGEPEQVFLKDLPKEIYRLQFLVDKKNENIRREEEISLQAGILVGKLYDALVKEYINPDENSLRSLNILCVRIVFCLYAEDAGLFETKTSFEDYINSFNLPNLREGIIKLFKGLDTKIENRDKYDTALKSFPYVNGGLFRDEQIEIPNFTEEIVDVIVNHCAPFNWSDISPTIFGAVFESTLNPEIRRKGGMHYTSIENIHKVIDPLFLNDLEAEFEEICTKSAAKQKAANLVAFQEKLGNLTFLDPACGSGNFLTESYISLRRLENRVISILNNGMKALGLDDFIKVTINQFYGIEINDFAVTVAKTALWIAESQMIRETEAILSQNIDFLPLKNHANIVEGNALRMDWATLTSTTLSNSSLSVVEGNEPNLFSGFTTQTDGKAHHYDYIIGNPPFVGKSYQTPEQKADMDEVFKGVKNYGNLDFVASWYKKSADLIFGTNTKCALVSTNSICQGIAVPPLWNYLFSKGIEIDFAWRTFRWDSESNQKAHVHCVIVGFSCNKDIEPVEMADGGFDKLNHPDKLNHRASLRRIFNADGTVTNAKNINAYLIDAPNIIVMDRPKPLADVPEMIVGSCPTDGGGFILSEEERAVFIAKEPESAKYIHTYIGSEEFINGKVRYCLWLKECSPSELLKMPLVMERVEQVRNFRLASKKEQTRRRAETPTLFAEDRYVPANSIIVPMLSSENRKYVPIGFIDKNIVASNLASVIPNGNLYVFSIITSNICMAWMRVVGSRMKSDYRFSATTVYNTFPWPSPSEEQKKKIEQTAQTILDAREKYADCTLAQLYGEKDYLFPELVKAHRENDKAVMAAYGFDAAMDESEIVARLFELYEAIHK